MIHLIFIIGILFAIFVNATINAIYLNPKYEDFCNQKYYPEPQKVAPSETKSCSPYSNTPNQDELDLCAKERGLPEYSYDSAGCVSSYRGCNYCQKEYDASSQKYNFIYFLLSSILAVIGIAIGLLLPTKNPLNEWIATGLMLGGLVTLFFGTFRYYEYLGRFIKPIVILIELVIVIYLSYKTLHKEPKNKHK